jgi:hypothetical protein
MNGKTIATLAWVAFIAACSSDSHPPAGGGVTTTGSSSGNPGGVGDAGDLDAGDGGSACSPEPLQGAIVAENLLNQNPPAPLGGPVAPGTYELVELDAYDPTKPSPSQTANSAQITIVIDGTNLKTIAHRSVADAGAPVQTVTSVAYKTNGTSLDTTSVCPTAGATKAIPYSAVGTNSIALFVDATHREVYQLRP